MHPDAVEDEVIRPVVALRKSQRGYRYSWTTTRDLQSDESIMAGSCCETQRPGTGFGLELNLGHHIAHRTTVEIGASRQGGNTSIAGSDACALRRQTFVWGTGTHQDPVRIVAFFMREHHRAAKRRPGL